MNKDIYNKQTLLHAQAIYLASKFFARFTHSSLGKLNPKYN